MADDPEQHRVRDFDAEFLAQLPAQAVFQRFA